MAAVSPTFDPIPTLEVRVPRRPALFPRMRLTPAVALVFGALGVAAVVGMVRNGPAAGRTVSVVPPVFMSFAVGDVQERVALRAEPGGGETVALLPAGTRVSIGGRVAFGGGWASGVAYWVAADIDGHAVRGFVPAGGVDVQAGDPPLLTFDGGVAAASASAVDASAVDVSTFDGSSLSSGVLNDAKALGSESAAPLAAAVGDGRGGSVAEAGVASLTIDRSAAAANGPVGASDTPTMANVVQIPWLPATVRTWTDLLNAAAATHGVAADLVAIVTLVESGGHPTARSHAGATGLMQVMPATGGDIARIRGLGHFDASRLNEPAVAVDFGAWYLAQQLKSFGQPDDTDWAKSVTLAAAAYNGGPGTAMRYQRGGGLPSETKHYIDWVGGMWRERADATSPTYERWMAAGGSVLVGKAQAWLDAGGNR